MSEVFISNARSTAMQAVAVGEARCALDYAVRRDDHLSCDLKAERRRLVAAHGPAPG